MSLIQNNLMTKPGYTPYCGGFGCRTQPRTVFKDGQFECPACKWRSQHNRAFIYEYVNKWGLNPATANVDEVLPVADEYQHAPCEHRWEEESSPEWRSYCSKCGQKAQGSGQ